MELDLADATTQSFSSEMKTYCHILMVGLTLSIAARGNDIEVGTKIDDAITAMEASGYNLSGFSVIHRDRIRVILGEIKKDDANVCDLKIWGVDQGCLIVCYIISTGMITDLTYQFYVERPKDERMDFKFQVASFNPKTAEMVVQTEKKKMKNKSDIATPRKPSD